jgi:hypothetical protein
MASKRSYTWKSMRVLKLVIVLLGVGAVWRLYVVINEPAKGVVLTSQPKATVAPAAKPPTLVDVSSNYVVFSYPDYFSVNNGAQPASPPILESFNYRRLGTLEPWILTVTVTSLNSPSLNADSGYSIRSLNPTEYQRQEVNLGGNNFVVMSDSKAGDFNKVAFTLRGSTSADISLTGDDYGGKQVLQPVFNQILSSFHWR